MKTLEELNALKEEVKTVNENLSPLTDEELAQVAGGRNGFVWVCGQCGGDFFVSFEAMPSFMQNRKCPSCYSTAVCPKR